MKRRHSWLPLVGACALFAACGPAVEPREETPATDTGEASLPEGGQVEALHERPGCACRPPVLVTPLTLGDTPTGLRAIVDLNGRPIINVFFNLTTDSALWTLVEREDSSCGSPTWDVVVLKSGLTGFPFPLDIALATERVLYFTASDGVHGNELWKTDGTPEGTVMVADINPGAADSLPRDFFALGRTLYFTADDGMHGRELWRSDGTARGTRLVADIHPGPASSEPRNLVKTSQDRLLFTADDGAHGREPWRSDGTARGTRLVEDIRPGPTSSDPGALFEVKSHDYVFTADDGVHGLELWKSDGTPGGTRLVEDIRPGPEGSGISLDPVSSAVTDRTIYFAADDGVHGLELWKSDGTPGGTRLTEDIRPGPEGSVPSDLIPLEEGDVVFGADDGIHGREPWRSDGTRSGTFLLADIFPGATSSFPVGVPARGKAYFYAFSLDFGHELWVTNGSRHGTHLVKDIQPGPGSAFPGDPNTPYAVGEGLIFQANDGEHGAELWWTDGTEEGTKMADLFPGPGSSDPFDFTRVGPWIYFTAVDGVHTGRSLFAQPVACFPKTGGSR